MMTYKELNSTFSEETKTLLAELAKTNEKSMAIVDKIIESVKPIKQELCKRDVYGILVFDLYDAKSFNETNIAIADRYRDATNEKEVGK